MNREALDRWCERGILGLVLAILVFSPLAFEQGLADMVGGLGGDSDGHRRPYTLNELPQPQVLAALGLRITKRAPSSLSS